MSHGFPRRRKRDRTGRKDKRPQLQPKPTAKPSLTSGIIADLACPISSRAFCEGMKELQSIPAIASR